MNRADAINDARKCFDEHGIELTVYHDEIGSDEFEDEPWGFCPTASLGLLARFRDQTKDITIDDGLVRASALPTLAESQGDPDGGRYDRLTDIREYLEESAPWVLEAYDESGREILPYCLLDLQKMRRECTEDEFSTEDCNQIREAINDFITTTTN